MSSTDSRYGLHAIVHGRVQGVFYRLSTQKKAQTLGLTGWVKNLENGDVELYAFGSAANLKALELWLWQGPRLARVDQVRTNSIATESHETFEIIR